MTQPMYHLIADHLRTQIVSGLLMPGEPLPTELELRYKYHASRNTIRDAIKRLISLGLVEVKPGQGACVVQEIDRSSLPLRRGGKLSRWIYGPKEGCLPYLWLIRAL